jgi:hypothetical protein
MAPGRITPASSGEYEGSTIDLTAHWIAVTIAHEF